MSNHLISEVYKRQVGNIARKAVMGLLADKASDDGSGIWASKQRMAEEIGASKQTIIATLKALIDDGLVREAGKRKCPNGYTIEYAIDVAALKAIPLVKSHQEDQSENLTGQAALPVKQVDGTSQILLPDQSENLTQTLLNPPKPPEEEEPVVFCADHVWDFYVETARDIGRPVPQTFDPDRRLNVEGAMRHYSLSDFQTLFANIRASPFLRGERADGRTPLTFDWLFEKRNFRKVLEGNFND